MRRFVEGFATRTGLKMALSISRKADQLPLAVQQSLLRVVQEALANVHRHASASQVSVTLKCMADQIHLMVSDDGDGIEGISKYQSDTSPKLGLGIPGMTERLRQLGGDLDIQTDATGTTLHGVIPAHVNGIGFEADAADDGGVNFPASHGFPGRKDPSVKSHDA
jgi:signal transduction histidine kinase